MERKQAKRPTKQQSSVNNLIVLAVLGLAVYFLLKGGKYEKQAKQQA